MYYLYDGHSFISKSFITHLPFDPEILLLGIHVKKIITGVCESLFTKEDSNPSQKNWIKNPQYATTEGFINCGASIQWNVVELSIANDVGEYLNI